MIADGRSMAQAIKAGTYFQITLRDKPDVYGRRRQLGTYDPPACETLDEVIEFFLKLFGPIGEGMTAEGARVVGGQIGGRILDSVIDITARLQPLAELDKAIEQARASLADHETNIAKAVASFQLQEANRLTKCRDTVAYRLKELEGRLANRIESA